MNEWLQSKKRTWVSAVQIAIPAMTAGGYQISQRLILNNGASNPLPKGLEQVLLAIERRPATAERSDATIGVLRDSVGRVGGRLVAISDPTDEHRD